MGHECEVIARAKTETSLACITSEITTTTLDDQPDIWTVPLDVDDKSLSSWLIASWNSNDIYSNEECSAGCMFKYAAEYKKSE